MTGHRNLGLVAAGATLLAAAPLSAIFERWTWLVESAVAVAVVAGAAALARALRAPLWGQMLGMLAGLTLALTWLFPAGSELLAVLPTPATLAHFGELLRGSAEDMRSYGVEVPDTPALLFITVLGIGAVAVVVDLLTVGLRRPALAGLPMLAIYSVPVAVYVDDVSAVPFVIGAAGYLWLLGADNVDRVRRFGRRFTGDGRDVDVWESSPLAAAGRRLAVLGVAVAVLLPLVPVPGMNGSLLDSLSSSNGSGNGNGRPGHGGAPGKINLFAALSGQLNQSEVADLVKVTTNEPDPFYLRFGVADELKSSGFEVTNPSGRPANRELPDPVREVNGVEQHQYEASVEITRDLDMPLLPVYSEPVRTDLNSTWLYDDDRQIVFSNRENSRGKRYSFEYVRSTYTVAALRSARKLPADHPLVRRQQTRTPPAPEVTELVARLVRGKQTEYDKVRAIYDYFSSDNGFSYQLRTEGGTSGADIVDFLTNKVGYCQQYAAAMGWLVRAAGIPARVAFGFTGGSNRSGNTYTLTNRNLHAWTEVYFDGIGWVPFDATPAYGVAGSTRSTWAPDTDAPDPLPDQPGAPNATPNPEGSAGAVGSEREDRDPDAGLSLGAEASTDQAPVWPWWAAGSLVLLLLLAMPALRRLALRRRRGGRAPTPVTAAVPDVGVEATTGDRMVVLAGTDADRARADAHAAWDELLDTLIDYRVPVDRTETPRATADRLVRDALNADTDAVTAIRLLGRAEERARYARDPLTGDPLAPALRVVRSRLATDADRRTRLLAAVLPPSVLLRWRLAVADTSGRMVTVTGQARRRLLRWNPRRLLADRAAR